MGLFGRKKEENVVKKPDDTLHKEYQKTETPDETLQRERVKKELDLLRGELEKTGAMLDSTTSRLDFLRNEYYAKSSEIDSLNEELQKKRSEVRSIRTEYTNLKSEFDRLNSELGSIRSQYNPRVLESTKQEIETVRTELTQLNHEKEDARVSLHELRSEADSVKSERDTLRSQLEEAKSELELVRSQSDGVKKEIDVVKKELALYARNPASPNPLDTTRKITQAAASLVASFNQKHAELKKELVIVQEALSRVKEENRKLKEEKMVHPDTVQNIPDEKRELESLKLQQQTKKQEFEQAKREIEFIQKELAALYSPNNFIPVAKTSRSLIQIKNEFQAPKYKLKVLLQPVGPVDPSVMEVLQSRLSDQFDYLGFELAPRPLALPADFFDTSRNQFSSPQIISWIEENCKEDGLDRILGICDADAYSGRLNFVLGEAQLAGRVAAVYLKMLRTELERSDVGEELFLQRVQKEAVHEIGHIFGLKHCTQRRCAMYFSNSLADTDFKSYQMCQSCTKKLLEQISLSDN